MSRFWVEKQNWQRFPRVINMCKDDGMSRKFVRYVREDKTKEEHDRVVGMFNAEYLARQNVEVENARLRELVRCLVYAEHPDDRATLIANAADMLAELGVEVDE